jgi:hypothetical protein
MRATVATLLLALTAAAPAADDVLVLLNGDRITGRIEGRSTRRYRVQTPYGLLVIPRDRVERVVHHDGREERVNAPASPPPAPAPPPPPPPIRLMITVKGDTFWQAWDPKSAPADPTLRLEVRIDHVTVASYTDANLDPEDLPKAVVNSFVFSPERLLVRAADHVNVGPPAVGSGEIKVALSLPPDLDGARRLGIAYQVNDGTAEEPQWRDVVSAESTVTLTPGRAAEVALVQGRGTMEFSRRRMRNVETFTASLDDTPVAP